MNFNSHLAAGMAAGTVAAGTAIVFAPDSSRAFVEIGRIVPREVSFPLSCFVAALAMSLFPDLDTASVPQRWFSRLVLTLLVLSFYSGKRDLVLGLALIPALTTIHKHRGWTHWRIVPWIIALTLAIARECLRARSSWFSEFSPENVLSLLELYWPLVFACVLGHYMHLLLDGTLFERPRFRIK